MRFEPFAATYNGDSAAVWRHLIDHGDRVTYDDQLDMWLIAGYDLVLTVLTDNSHFTTIMSSHQPDQTAPTSGASRLAGTTVAPMHERSRAALSAVFATTSTRVEHRWGALIARRANDYADQLADQVAAAPWPDADLMDLFCFPYALDVLLDVLGMPADDSSRTDWAADLAAITSSGLNQDRQSAASNRLLTLWDHCHDLVEQRAVIPLDAQPPGLITDLLAYRAGGDHRLTLPDIAALVLTVVCEGWKTTAAALGHALEHGLRQQARWARLGFDDHYASVHAEESLRHSPTVQAALRETTTDVDIDGAVIPAGSRCLILIGSANHDERHYATPTAFQPHRARLGQHLSFGAGTNYCTGAALTRLTLTTALQTLARRLPDLSLAPGTPTHYRPSLTLRRHNALLATLTSATGPAVDDIAPAVLP